MIQRLESKPSDGRLMEFNLFTISKGSLKGDLISAYQHLHIEKRSDSGGHISSANKAMPKSSGRKSKLDKVNPEMR